MKLLPAYACAGALALGVSEALCATFVPVPQLKPSLEERANFAAMSRSARTAMLHAVAQGLVAELEADPKDVEAWLRLGRARLALGERAAAVEAYERAVTLQPGSPGVLRAYATNLLGEPDPATGAPAVGAEAAEVYRRLALTAARDPEPHWYLGLAALQAGTPLQAARHWRDMLALLDPEHPSYAQVEARLAELEAGAARPQ